MCGLPTILSLFRNKLDKFNITGARMLDYIYHMEFKYLKSHFRRKTSTIFSHLLRNIIMDVITFPKNLLATSGLSILLHSVI